MKKAFIIVGLGFGDEGKGLATDYLCGQSVSPLVIRFNGGHQAGHTVVTASGERHIFSCFGSGTFRNVPTYWSRYCTVLPSMVLAEYKKLQYLGKKPSLLLDLQCPITTHYDILYNRALESTRGQLRHGSCGLGFGATIERHQFPSLKLCVQDLLSPSCFVSKLQAIKKYYQEKINGETKYSFNQFDHDSEDQLFNQYVHELIDLNNKAITRFVHEGEIFYNNNLWETYIFEGAQGIMLDMDFGNWPHVTRSNTTSKNALMLLNQRSKYAVQTEIFYVTRSYQTRHGAGPFSEHTAVKLINNSQETNRHNEYQESFRASFLDIDLLNYALKCDENFSLGLQKHILITCLDQLEGDEVNYCQNGIIKKIHFTKLPSLLTCSFVNQYFSFDSCSDNIQVIKGKV